MSTPRFLDVQNQIVAATVAALNAANIAPAAQVGIGQSVSTELVKILNAGQYQITLFQREGTSRNTSRYPSAALFPIANPNATLIATVTNPTGLGSPWTITLTGSVGAGAYLTAIVGATATKAVYACNVGDSLATVATNFAAAINAVSGVTASATGAVISVNLSPCCLVNVTGVGIVLAREVERVSRSVQMTLSCPTPDMRFQIADVIEQNIGTSDAPFLTLSDGTRAFCENLGGATSGPDDDSQSSYSLYIEHFVFGVEYGVLKTQAGYPIAVVDATLTTPSGVSQTVLSGGTS